MKDNYYFLLFIFSVIILQCDNDSKFDKFILEFENTQLPFQIDSSYFVKSLNYDKLKLKSIESKYFNLLSVQEINKKHGDYELYEKYYLNRIDFSKDIIGLLIFAPRNKNLAIDSFVEKIFLVIYNKSGQFLADIELGYFEGHFGHEKYKTFLLTEDNLIHIFLKDVKFNMSTNSQHITRDTTIYFIDNEGFITNK